MVQGKTKGLQAKAANPRHAHKAAANMKKGRRDVAPKKTVLVKQAVMHKVCVSSLSHTPLLPAACASGIPVRCRADLLRAVTEPQR